MFAKPGYGRANNVIGNADLTPLGFAPLRPQTVTSAEAILNLRLLDGALELDAGIYAQEVGDPIQFQQIATDFIAVNADNTRNIGAVLSFRAQVERLSGYATLSVQREIRDAEIVRSPPSQYPNHFGTAGLTLGVPEVRLVLNTHLRWATRRGATQSNVLLNNQELYSLPAYAVLDVTASTVGLYLLGDDRSETRFSFSVRDVLDTQYSEPGFGGFDIPSLGRTFWIELRQMFL
jgi:iron complex outermembrane receptor protein